MKNRFDDYSGGLFASKSGMQKVEFGWNGKEGAGELCVHDRVKLPGKGRTAGLRIQKVCSEERETAIVKVSVSWNDGDQWKGESGRRSV